MTSSWSIARGRADLSVALFTLGGENMIVRKDVRVVFLALRLRYTVYSYETVPLDSGAMCAGE